MKLHLHDHSGHAFQAQLSRHLAHLGHEVVHGFSSQFESPHGRLEVGAGDAPTLRMQPTTAAVPFDKYNPIRRTRYELSYAKAWQRNLDREQFDVVIACNVPLFTLDRMRRYWRRRGQRWVLWHQDIYSRAIADEAGRKLPGPAAPLVARAVQRMERLQVAQADAVVAIGEPFVAEYQRWGLDTDHVRVIPNWSPLDEITPGPRDNSWAQRHGLPADAVRLIYAGTLGRKHNPLLLLQMLDRVRASGVDAVLVVASEGVGAEDLRTAADGRPDVRILPFQPASEFGEMLASADVLIALLEPSAAEFSVPSKVLSYLCAGRPTVALMPESNAAAVDVREAGGFVAPPSPDGARRAADWIGELGGDRARAATVGQGARDVAVRRFDIDRIGAEFEAVLSALVPSAPSASA